MFNNIMEVYGENTNNQLPDQTYAYEMGIRSIEQIANENNGISYFINACARSIIAERKGEFERLTVLSSYVASVFGGALDGDERSAIANAFLKGAITGECVSNCSYNDAIDITDTMIVIEAGREQFDDDSAFYRNHGPQLIEAGRQAKEQLAICSDTIERWAFACVEDIRHHHFYEMGLAIYMGNSAKAMQDSWKANDLKLMGEQIETGEIDWDAAFLDIAPDNS